MLLRPCKRVHVHGSCTCVFHASPCSSRNVSIASSIYGTVPSPIDTPWRYLTWVFVGHRNESLLAKSSKRFERSYLDQSGQLTWYFPRERSCRLHDHVRASISRDFLRPSAFVSPRSSSASPSALFYTVFDYFLRHCHSEIEFSDAFRKYRTLIS